MDQLKKLFIRNENAYMLLKGNNHDSAIFLFIHGYGSSPLDLLPLAKQINSTGYSCALIMLSGHGGSGEDLIGQSYSKWKNDLKKAILHFGKTYNSIYLIGFSLGATLCLDVSDCKKDTVHSNAIMSDSGSNDSSMRIMENGAKQFQSCWVIGLYIDQGKLALASVPLSS